MSTKDYQVPKSEATEVNATAPIDVSKGFTTDSRELVVDTEDLYAPQSAVEPFPLDVLPGPVSQLVQEGAHSFHCPIDLIAVPALVACGVAIGNARHIEVKDGWRESTALYAVAIAHPGGAKTPGKNLATAPLIRHAFHRITTDATVEALGLQLRDQPAGVLSSPDEIMAFLGGLNKYRRGVGNDRQFYESAWSGGDIAISRVRTENGFRKVEQIVVRQPHLAIYGTIQPDLLKEFVDPKHGNDGFVDRFLFSFAEEIPVAYSEKGVSAEARDQYEVLVLKLMEIDFEIGAETGIQFSAEGRIAWDRRAAEHMALQATAPECQRTAWSKFLAYAARLALILHLMWRHSGETQDERITAVTVDRAFRLVTYFISHNLKVHNYVMRDEHDARLAILMRWISDRDVKKDGHATIRAVLTSKVAGYRNSGEVMAAFKELAKSQVGRIIDIKPKGGGRASVSFRLGVKS